MKVRKDKVTLINQQNLGKPALNADLFSKAEFFLCMDGDSQLVPNIKVAVRHLKIQVVQLLEM
jgi:hypothetical protein